MSDRSLLDETLRINKSKPKRRKPFTGPFLSPQRQKRDRHYARTCLFNETYLIDEMSPSLTAIALECADEWNFDSVGFDSVSGGCSLVTLCTHLFDSYGLYKHFQLRSDIVYKLFSMIEDGYHWRNAYHNHVHGTDVTQAMHCLIRENFIWPYLTEVEKLSAIIGAAVHDYDHPGVTQPFLIKSTSHLAPFFSNQSILENHHWRSGVSIMKESGLSDSLDETTLKQVKRYVKELVLATDLSRHDEFLSRLKDLVETESLDMRNEDHRLFMLQVALKCADVSNPCREWQSSRQWSCKITEEFFRQGDYEKTLKLPVSTNCDRFFSSAPKIQINFIKYIVVPLFDLWNKALNSSLSREIMTIIDSNLSMWENILAKEQEGEMKRKYDKFTKKYGSFLNKDRELKILSSSGLYDPVGVATELVTNRASYQEEEHAIVGVTRKRSLRWPYILMPKENFLRYRSVYDEHKDTSTSRILLFTKSSLFTMFRQ